jgi:hypothetical protein
MSQKSTLFILIFFFFYSNVFAESIPRSYNSSAGSSVRGQVARIMMSGLGGAVFGVSTLSFYGEPQKHLSNVAFGAAIGLLIGSVYVTSETLKDDYSYSYQQGSFYDREHAKTLISLESPHKNSMANPLLFVWTKDF